MALSSMRLREKARFLIKPAYAFGQVSIIFRFYICITIISNALQYGYVF